jgi:septation ring formation regulator EzrA
VDEHEELSGIKGIEDAVREAGENTLMIPFGQNIVSRLSELYRKNDNNTHLISAGKIILPSQYRNILDKAKQRLLDILIELQDKFPNMEDDFAPTNAVKEQARNIVNYYVNGNSNNTNLGVGDKVVQKSNTLTITNDLTEFTKQLKELSVPFEDIDSIKEVIQSKDSKDSKLSKAMKWIGQLSKKMITKGIELKLPEIIDATEKMIDKVNS